jgi:hypothetical protein
LEVLGACSAEIWTWQWQTSLAERTFGKRHNGKHYYIGTALANLGGVYVERRQYDRVESYFRDALDMYAKTLPDDHKLIGITRVRRHSELG